MKLSICFERTDGSVSEHESSFPYELTDAQVASIFREVLVLAESAVRKNTSSTNTSVGEHKLTIDEMPKHIHAVEDVKKTVAYSEVTSGIVDEAPLTKSNAKGKKHAED